jgi:DNA-binding PadR family transcriptional regulator
MSLKHAILGFLSFQPFSGYDLKKAFDQSVQHFWPANQSQIYRTLAKMTEEGLVEQEVIEREERLDMKLYHLTEAGREELHQWLSTPLPPTETRDPFLIQLFFGSKLSDEELVNLLQREIQTLEEQKTAYFSAYQAYLETIKTHPDPRAFFLSVLTMEFGILGGLVALEWLKSVVERVQSGDYTLRDFQLEKNV